MVNYPHKVAKKTLVSTQRKHPVDFANRGMTFEKMINESNQYYLSRGLA
ncbi:MAG: Holliday junction resolvase RecU, partial [Streptococcus parasanguinis]|nr:Holliday junction resolvase RecU [Streptococcus parasanguinis]